MAETDQEADRLLTRLEVGERYGIPKRYLELAKIRGEGPAYVRVGRLVRYREADVVAWIEANRVETAIAGAE